MFIALDMRCISPDCGHTEGRFVRKSEVDTTTCSKCDSSTVTLPAGTATTFRHADTKLKR